MPDMEPQGFEKILSTGFLKNLVKMLLFWASIAFLIFYLPIVKFSLFPELTQDALLMILGAFVVVTSFLLSYLVT